MFRARKDGQPTVPGLRVYGSTGVGVVRGHGQPFGGGTRIRFETVVQHSSNNDNNDGTVNNNTDNDNDGTFTWPPEACTVLA